MADRMFDKDSFKDEVTTKEDAEQCIDYLSSNELNFRRELEAEGLEYDAIETAVGEVWTNLVNTCKRVGYTDNWVERKAAQFGIKK